MIRSSRIFTPTKSYATLANAATAAEKLSAKLESFHNVIYVEMKDGRWGCIFHGFGDNGVQDAIYVAHNGHLALN